MDTTETSIAIVDPIKKELQTQSITEKILHDMVNKCMAFKMVDPNDKMLYRIIEENRKQIKRTRLVIQKAYKIHIDELKSRAKLLGGDCDAMIGILTQPEEHLEKQAAIYEAEQERKKKEAEALKSERQNALSKLGARLTEDEKGYTIGKITVAIMHGKLSIFEMEREQWSPILQQVVDEALDIEKEKKRLERINTRQQAINKTGAILQDGLYVLGDLRFLESELATIDEDRFNDWILELKAEKKRLTPAPIAKPKEATLPVSSHTENKPTSEVQKPVEEVKPVNPLQAHMTDKEKLLDFHKRTFVGLQTMELAFGFQGEDAKTCFQSFKADMENCLNRLKQSAELL